jgi:pimeloyl-ACP methyl ester carboxylesterase
MREVEEVEGFGLPLPELRPLLGRVPAKADQPGFIRVQRQFELSHSLTIPVLSLAAAQGLGDLSHDSIAQLADSIERRTIAEARHFLVQDQPRAAAEAILGFLTRP